MRNQKEYSNGNGDRISWKDYVDIKLGSLEKSTIIAKESMEIRLANMNEFREQLTRQETTYLTKMEYGLNHTNLELKLEKISDEFRLNCKNIEKQVNELQTFKAVIDSKANQGTVWIFYIISIINIILLILDFAFKKGV